MLRVACFVAACLALSACVQSKSEGGAAPAATVAGSTIDRETLTRRMLDVCVYRQYAAEGVNRASMIEDCRCATRTAMKATEGDSFSLPRSGGLAGAQDAALRQGIAACFKA